MNYYIPPELINEIVHHVLDNAPSRQNRDKHGENSKPEWELIQSLTLACREFRLIGLGLWFRKLYLQSSSDIKDINDYFPTLKSWCRHLHCVQTEDSESFLWDLAGFKCLSSLRVDWLCLGNCPFGDVEHPFTNVESKIEELDVRGLKHPSPMIINSLVAPFVDLTTLKLDCPRIWCSLCNTCTLVRFPSPNPGGSPSGFIYEGGLGLPYHYARFLFPLKYLEEVFFRLPDIGPRHLSPGLSAQANEYLWMGECDQCMAWMYEDDEFRRVWVNRKKGINPSNIDKWSVYPNPPRLKKVHWSFWNLGPTIDNMPYSLAEIDSEDDPLTDSDSEVEQQDGETGPI